MMVFVNVVCAVYVVLNVVCALTLSLRAMAEEFWEEQNFFGKVCVNLFYAPAWALSAIFVAVVFALRWVLKGLWWVGKVGSRLVQPLYAKAVKGNL